MMQDKKEIIEEHIKALQLIRGLLIYTEGEKELAIRQADEQGKNAALYVQAELIKLAERKYVKVEDF